MSITEPHMGKIILPRVNTNWADPRPRLDKHTRIGLDYDGTLIGGDGQLVPGISKHLHDYVATNYREKEFWIVTFRNEMDSSHCLLRLSHYGLSPDMFKGIRWTRPRLVADMDEINLLRQGGYTGPQLPLETEFYEYKAKACKETGLTVLVDDLPDCVEDACKLHGIEFIHAWDFARL